MPKIKNRLFQPLTILLEDKKTLYLQTREEAEVSDSDLESPHLQSMIKKGDIAVLEGGKRPEPPRSRRSHD